MRLGWRASEITPRAQPRYSLTRRRGRSSKTPFDAPRLALSNGVRGAASVLQVPERQGRKEDDFRRWYGIGRTASYV